MRVAFEVLGLIPGQIGGMEAYVRNLFDGLAQSDKLKELRVLVGPEGAGELVSSKPTVTEFVAHGQLPAWLPKTRYGQSLIQWVAVERELRHLKPDVLHCTMFAPRPPWAGRNMVLSLHDLYFINCAYTCGRLTSAVMTAHCRLGARRAGKILTLSEHSKRDIIRHYNVPENRIDVVPLAVDHSRFFPARDPADLAAFRQRYDLPADYLLYPANTWPHKNHVRLLEALAHLRDAERLSSPLVLTGARKRGDDELERTIARLGLQGQVRRLDYIPLADLACCYQAAKLMVFPSLHEGFGLPVLEAMACGCPVVCSSTTSLGEVAGNAAVVFNPTSTGSIAEAIGRVLTSPELRTRLRKLGLARAAQFTWERTASQTLNTYSAVA